MTRPADDPPEALWDVHQHSERRSLILCTIGAVAGLIVAGAGLFSAQGTRIAGVPPEDVAIVNQVPILMSDYQSVLQSTYSVSLERATPEQRRKALDEMIREELYVQRGIELGLQSDVIEVRQALVGAVEAQQSIDVSATQPFEADLRAFHHAQLARYSSEGTMAVRDLIAPTVEAAQKAVAALRTGRPAPQVLQTYNLQASGRVGNEEYYFAARIHLAAPLFRQAAALRDGQVSDPIVLPDGVHVLIMQRNRPPVPMDYASVRDRVLGDYRTDKIAHMQSGADRFLRKRADIQIAKGFE